MDVDRVAELMQRKRELAAERAALGLAAKRRRDNERAAKASEDRQWSLVDSMLHVTLIMFVLADCKVEPPVLEFLKCQGRQRHWAAKSDDELAVVVEDAFRDADLGHMASLSDVEEPSDPPAMLVAAGRMLQGCLASWVEEQNRVRGVAPSTATVLLRFEALRLQVPEAFRPSPWGTSDAASSRVKMDRWRRRWGGRYGALRKREFVPVAVMREKAGVAVCIVHAYSHTPSDACFLQPHSRFGPRIGALLGARRLGTAVRRGSRVGGGRAGGRAGERVCGRACRRGGRAGCRAGERAGGWSGGGRAYGSGPS
jgi:hypothetical protein